MNFQDLMKQAQQLKQMQEDVAAKRFEGGAGGGMVTVVLSGDKQLLSLKLDLEAHRHRIRPLESTVPMSNSIAPDHSSTEASTPRKSAGKVGVNPRHGQVQILYQILLRRWGSRTPRHSLIRGALCR